MSDFELNEFHSEALKELLNIGVGTAADVLSQMARNEIRLNVPKMYQIPQSEVYQKVLDGADENVVSVIMRTEGFFSGESMLLFAEHSSLSLVKAILSEQVPLEMLHELEEEALAEVGNVVLSACLATFADLLGKKVVTSIPFCSRGSIDELLAGEEADHDVLFICVDFSYEEGRSRGYISLMFTVSSMEDIVDALDMYLKKVGVL